MSVRVLLACGAAVEPALRLALVRDPEITVSVRLPTSAGRAVPLAADVLVLDIESFGPSAMDLVEHIMRSTPLPILALCPAEGTAQAAIEALLWGAVDAIPRGVALDGDARVLRQRVHVVSGVTVVRRHDPPSSSRTRPRFGSVVAVAASTGGPAALAVVLASLSGLPAPVLLVQHLHEDFMAGFVSWLGGLSALPVTEAKPGDAVRAGHVYVAPAGRHLRLAPDRTLALADLPVAAHCPSANELFGSVAGVAGARGIGVLLTGMGDDGAKGLLAMRRAGAHTFVQDRETCAVFGMPRAALDIGAADAGLPLAAMAAAIRQAAGQPATGEAATGEAAAGQAATGQAAT